METIILIIVLAVVFVALVLEAPGRDELRTPGEGAEEATGGVIAPPAPARVPAQPSAPEIEKPPPSAGRLVRLRDRLARAPSSMGSVLLGLLSRDRLDDDTWDEIEEVLITADVGVVPARQITSDRRTQGGGEGARTLAEARGEL